jgi:hypothetical protein
VLGAARAAARRLDLQARHPWIAGVRQRPIAGRTRPIDRLRGPLRERGIGQGRARLRKALAQILEDVAAPLRVGGPMPAALVRELQADWWRPDKVTVAPLAAEPARIAFAVLAGRQAYRAGAARAGGCGHAFPTSSAGPARLRR